MRRGVTLSLAAVAAALGGVFAAGAVAPCALPGALMDRLAPGKAAYCPVSAAAAETPRVVEPPAVTVARAAKREFVDRLFVSGTLVAREEAQVAARIDGLTIVEVDAEDGDRVKQGQVLARLDRTQLDALMAENDAATKRADAAIDQARSVIAQSEAQVDFATERFRPCAQARGGDHGRFDRPAARDGDEDGAGPTRRRAERAWRRRSRPQEPRRRAAGASGAHRPDGGQGARRGHRQPPLGQARRLRLDLGRAALPHHRGRRDRSRGGRARADAGEARRRHAGATQAAGRRGPGRRPRPPGEPGGRQGEPHRQGPDRAWRRFTRPCRRLRLGTGRARPPRGRWRPGDGASSGTATRRASTSCATARSRCGG